MMKNTQQVCPDALRRALMRLTIHGRCSHAGCNAPAVSPQVHPRSYYYYCKQHPVAEGPSPGTPTPTASPASPMKF